MTNPDDVHTDRRSFLRIGGAFAALGAASHAFGALPNALASIPGVESWMRGPAANPFEMIVLGDSIMWGQGLREEQKFSTLVQKWVQTKMPGTVVNRHVYAHSGARILGDDVADAKPPTHGEVPNHFPSVTKQLDVARTGQSPLQSFDPANVGLVLLDGGINDFGTKIILNLDPTVGRAWIRKITRERGVQRIHAILSNAMRSFPNAKIVVTNYFQIVSGASEMVYIWELLRLWNLIGSSTNLASSWVKEKMTDQSLAFHEEFTSGLREAVADVATRTPSRATAATTRPKGARIMTPSADLRLHRPRIAMADVGFGPSNAYGAPDRYLFYLNEPDPAASVRKPHCVEQTPQMSLEFPNCLLAAAGHPNVRGAQVYAGAIQRTLESMVPEWRTL